MTREEFEQLASAALDQPHDAALQARVAAAIAGDPPLAAVFDQWRRVGLLVRRATAVRGVRWERFGQRISAALAAHAAAAPDADAELDAALLQTADVAGRVDWDRFAQRVSAAVAAESSLAAPASARPAAARIIRPRRLWLGRALLGGGFAAAAAIGFLALLRFTVLDSDPQAPPAAAPLAFAAVTPAPVSDAHPGIAAASFTRLPEGDAAGTAARTAAGGEVFMIFRPAGGGLEADTLGYF